MTAAPQTAMPAPTAAEFHCWYAPEILLGGGNYFIVANGNRKMREAQLG
jgi:hypothetical protein